MLAALKPPGPCWYLNGTGVDPSARRTGLGSALINQMLPRIDDDAPPAFLDTSAPDNLGYYERFGFLVTAELTRPNGGYISTCVLFWPEACISPSFFRCRHCRHFVSGRWPETCRFPAVLSCFPAVSRFFEAVLGLF